MQKKPQPKPQYKKYMQYDESWGKEKLGYPERGQTIAQKGCTITCISMMLSAVGKHFNPLQINQWLKKNNGFTKQNLLIWGAINSLGVTFQGRIQKDSVSTIKQKFDKGMAVICSVKNQSHFVLMTGYKDDTIYVNDPGYKAISSYELKDICGARVYQLS